MMNLTGSYRILLDGEEVSNSKNTVTVNGKKQIHSYLAGTSGTWASAISIGAGTTAATDNDTHLDFEISRDVVVSSQAIAGTPNKILLKAEFPDDLQCVVYETGVHSTLSTSIDGGNSQLLTDFSEATWSGGTQSISNARVGSETVSLEYASGAAVSTSISNLDIDFSDYSTTDKLYLALHTGTATSLSISITISDGTNSHTYTPASAISAGIYKIIEFSYEDSLVKNISSISISSTSVGIIYLDGLRINNATEYGVADILVSRSVLGTPITKLAGSKLEVEYSLAVS